MNDWKHFNQNSIGNPENRGTISVALASHNGREKSSLKYTHTTVPCENAKRKLYTARMMRCQTGCAWRGAENCCNLLDNAVMIPIH